MQQNARFVWIVLCLSVGGWGLSPSANGQILPDATLPVNSIVTPQDNTFQIDGGTAAGGNLFHSFQDFSLPTGSSAFFNNALTVENIITRVTGGNSSNIDGLITANGTANLFLINPNGIVFGANARLEIGGSFLGSTADRVLFADGSFFSATDTASTPPLLTVNVPIGLQFGPQPGGIRVEGPGNGLYDPEDGPLERNLRNEGLQVRPGRTLALVGGQIDIEGGNLTAVGDVTPIGPEISPPEILSGGRIELGSVGGNNTVSLTSIPEGWELGYEEVRDFQDIVLTNAASLDVSGNPTGTIQVRGRSIAVRDGSFLLALTLGRKSAQENNGIFINTSEALEVTGSTQVREPSGIVSSLGSRLQAEVWLNASGNGGDVEITTNRLLVDGEGAIISSGTRGIGNGGDLTVSATEIDVAGGQLLARTDAGGSGNGGNINLNTDRLRVQNGGEIAASTQSSGLGGDVIIHAREVEVITNINNPPENLGVSAIRSTVDSGGTGNGGNVTVEANDLLVEGGSSISTTTQGKGNAGNLTIGVDRITLSGDAPPRNKNNTTQPSRLESQTNSRATGNAGDVNIQAGRLLVEDGARISVSTNGEGDAGSVNIDATDVELRGVGQEYDFMTEKRRNSSGIFAQVCLGNTCADHLGSAGDVTIHTDRLLVSRGATLSVIGDGSGRAGTLNIGADTVWLDQGSLTAETSQGKEGNINLSASNLQLHHGSRITTNATGVASGGNINIDTKTLVALENSDITANAQESNGGRVSIASQGIFGTQFREQLTPKSDITATSELGPELDGVVTIQTPDVDPSNGLNPLPETPIDAASLIGKDACSGGEDSGLFYPGSGGLPPTPGEVLPGEELSPGLIDFPPDWESDAIEENRSPVEEEPVRRLVEAQGWFVDDRGRVILTANPPVVTPQGSVEARSLCHVR